MFYGLYLGLYLWNLAIFLSYIIKITYLYTRLDSSNNGQNYTYYTQEFTVI